MSFEEKAKATGGLILVIILFVTFLPGFINWWINSAMENSIRAPAWHLLSIMIFIIFAIISASIAIATETNFFYIWSVTSIVIIILHLIHFTQGYRPMYMMEENHVSYNKKVAEYHDAFIGEVNRSMRIEYYRQVERPKAKKEQKPERVSEERPVKRTVQKFIREIKKLDIRDAQKHVTMSKRKSFRDLLYDLDDYELESLSEQAGNFNKYYEIDKIDVATSTLVARIDSKTIRLNLIYKIDTNNWFISNPNDWVLNLLD